MYGQTSMSGMPDLYAENRKRLVLIVEDEYVNRELLKALRVHEVVELTVVVQVSQVHIDNIRAFCGISRFEGFLNTGASQQAAQFNARKRLAFTWFNEFAGFYRIRFAI